MKIVDRLAESLVALLGPVTVVMFTLPWILFTIECAGLISTRTYWMIVKPLWIVWGGLFALLLILIMFKRPRKP